jgi:8-amino-7-oxononanoate synthase
MIDFSQKTNALKKQKLHRKLCVYHSDLLDFCSNDYLGLKNHPQVVEAFQSGAKIYGVGSGASHLVSGHTKAHQMLEEALADFLGVQKILLFSTGYMANLGVFSALKDELDWVLQDKLNHASLIDANHLIQLPLRRYSHQNLQQLQNKAEKCTGQGLIVTDNVFSMDGDKANIDEIQRIAIKNNAILYQDDAHGFGVFSPNIPKRSIYMATLGKAVGTMGALVAGDADMIDFLLQKSRPYTYTTALPAALCVATLKSLEIIKNGEQQEKLLKNIQFFKTFAKELNLPILPSDSAIQPLIIGNNTKTLSLFQQLLDKKIHVGAIRTPTVPRNTERLRITLNAKHNFKQIKQLLESIKNAL